MSDLMASLGLGQRRTPVGTQRRRTVYMSSAAVLAVRRDWPDGTHEFIRPRRDAAHAARELERDRGFWRRGPVRPELSIVEISRHEFRLHGRHRQNCRAPDCVRASPAAREVSL